MNSLPLMVCPVCSAAKIMLDFQTVEHEGQEIIAEHRYYCGSCCIQFNTEAYDTLCKQTVQTVIEGVVQEKVARCSIAKAVPLGKARDCLSSLEEDYVEIRVIVSELLQGFYNDRKSTRSEALSRVARSLQVCKDLITTALSDRDRQDLINNLK